MGKGPVDDMGELFDIEAAGGHVGGHKYGQALVPEFSEYAFARILAQVAVESFRVVAPLGEGAGELVGFHLGRNEDDAEEILFAVHDAAESLEPVPGVDLYPELLGQFGRQGFGLVLEDFHVAGPLLDDVEDGGSESGREEEHPHLGIHRFHHGAYVVDEAHVEHFVGFVEYEVLEVGYVQAAPAYVVEHAARGADDDIGSLGEPAQLLPDGGAAVDAGDSGPCPVPQG